MADSDRKVPSVLDANGVERFLGHFPSDRALVSAIPTWKEAGNELIPESEWEEFDEWPEGVKIKDQNGKGACNGHAAALTLELERYAAGETHVPLSAWFVYAILCGGVDRGSNIMDALTLLSAQGTCPETLVKYATINPQSLSAEAHQSAANYKIELGTRCQTYQEIGTAIQRRRPLNASICVGNRFNSLDADGVPGWSEGMGNHAITLAFGMKKSARWGWLVKMANSWSTQWGLNGFCWLPLTRLPESGYFECYEVRAVTDTPGDATNPPAL